MPYAWQIAGDAIADLRDLEPWLQEEVLDEFERLTENPSLLRINASGYAVHDFERLRAGRGYVVFLKLHKDDVRQMLSVLGIAAHFRPRTQPPP